MNQSDFLSGLKEALAGEVSQAIIQENVRFYGNYIEEEKGNGKKEADVIAELGDPRWLAKTIIDTSQTGTYEEKNSKDDVYRVQGEYRSSNRVRYYDLSKWYWKALLIGGVVVVIFLVIALIFGIFSLIVPLLIPFLILIAIVSFIRNMRK